MATNYSSTTYDPYLRAAQEDRCAPRVSLKLPATLRPSGAPGFQVVVTDLSLGGFSCEAVTGMRPGALCWITLPAYRACKPKWPGTMAPASAVPLRTS